MKKYILASIISLCFTISYGQWTGTEKYSSQTPEASSINRYGDIPVDGSTGVPSIGLPIYTLSEGNLSLPISLSYHAGGMKASDQATWVGMGWTLSAGGIISRSINGFADENPLPKIHPNQNLGWYSNRGTNTYIDNSKGGYTFPDSTKYIDSEPDMFNFSIPGHSGKFYFDNNRNIIVVPRQDLEIYVRYDSSSTERQFNGFWIVTPDGNEYHFAKTYRNNVVATDYIENIKEVNFNVNGYSPNFSRSTWLLSKIYSADGKDSITLNYTSQKYSYWNLNFKTRTNNADPSNPINSYPLFDHDINTQTDVEGKRLTTLTTSNNIVSFVADANNRTDLARYSTQGTGLNMEAKGLSEIIVQDKQSQCVIKSQFFRSTTTSSSTTGVGGLPGDDSDKNRMYLDSVRMIDCVSGQSMTNSFEYYDRGLVQRKLTYGQDHWGFMNGDATLSSFDPGDVFVATECYDPYLNPASLCPTNKRNPNLSASQRGTLKKMTYPTGGSSEFTYELNEVADIKSTCNFNTLYTFNLWCGNCPCSNSAEYSITLTAYDVSNGYIEFLKDSCVNASAYASVYTSSDVLMFGLNSSLTKLSQTSMPPGGGTFKIKVSTTGSPAYVKVFTKIVTSGVQNVPVGGLRIKTIQTKDGSGTVANTKTYSYNESSTLSTGKPVYRPKYLQVFHDLVSVPSIIHKYVNGSYVVHSGSVQFKNPETGSWKEIQGGTSFAYKWLTNSPASCITSNFLEIPYLYLTNTGSTAQTNKLFAEIISKGIGHQNYGPPGTSIQGNHIGYQKVAISETDNGTTIRYFDMGSYSSGPADPKGYPLIPSKYEPNLGNLTTEEVYDDLGNILTSSHFSYTSKVDTVVPYGYYSPIKFVILGPASVGLQYYALETGYSLLSSKTDKIYDPANAANFLSTVTNYAYNTQNGHYQKASESVTNSDGMVYRTEYKYSKDYPCPTGCTSSNAEMDAILSMRKKNMVNSPIEEVKSYKLPTSGTFLVYDATYTKMDKIGGSTSHIKPGAIYRFLTNTPTSTFTYSSGTASSFTKHAGYTQEYNFAYDVYSGKLISQWKQNDPSKIQYIWAHGYKKLIANVLNAESSEIAYTSFENISSIELGGWTISGTTGGTSTATGNFVSGASGYNLTSSRTISKAALPSGTYLLSFFHKNGIVSVNGVTASTNTGSAWKYVEYKVTVTGGSVTITGSASYPSQYIDELRLIPYDAQMTSFNYHAGSLLPTSVNDVNSISNHFEYDGLWRLKTIFDNDLYVKQAFVYDYKLGTNVNRVRSYKTNTATTTHTAAIALTGSNVERSFQFFDGLGRSVQSVGVALSPTSLDVISNTTYDLAYRALKVYLPYTESSNGGAYRSSWLTAQTNFVNAYDGSTSGYGYSETKYEKSPLGRPVEMGQPTNALRIGNGHTHEIKYRLNTSFDNVRDFLNNNYYAANSLTVEEHTDENEAKSWVFKDKLGRIVMEKMQIALSPTVENDHYARTYTIYDDFGRTAYVLPPETSKKMATSSNWTHTSATYTGMVYKYSYDTRGRVSDKKIPGKNSELITYDRLDRPVLATTALGHKIFIKYDILGREVLSGVYTGTGSPTGSEALYESETSSTTYQGYTNNAFPGSTFTIHNVSYYDHYDFDRNSTITGIESYTNPGGGYSSTPFGRSRGQMTGGKVGVIVGNTTMPSSYLTSSNFYDDEYALIQTKSDNHIGGTDVLSSAYDFAGRTIKQNRVHSSTTVSAFTTEYVFGYDHASRPLYTTIKVGSDPVKILNKFKYDELGRLMEKNLHSNSGTNPTGATDYTQSIDYTYTLLGWNTKINDVFNSSQAGDVNPDLFMFNLEYDYLGNITAPSWNVNRTGFSIGNVKQYRVDYDAARRITASTYWTMNTSWVWTNGNQYTENDLQYDLNGNIKALKRQGLLSGTTFGNMDNLTYTYDANNPDRLTRVQDNYSATKGFIQGSTATTTYTYDNAGNLITDAHKGLTIIYNFLNLPAEIVGAGDNTRTFAYTTTGVKLTKYNNGLVSRQYVGGIEYDNTTLAAIYTPEGRVIPNGASWHYEYSIKDHLGNVRVNFRANTSTTSYTFLDEHHYYPFGLEHEGSTFGGGDKYRYNGKEINEDLGLNWNDYGARWYDPALGRWNSVDILSEIQVDQSVYQYSYNNPVTLNDPSGMCPTCNSAPAEEETEGADRLTNTQWLEANRSLDGSAFAKQRNFSNYNRNAQWERDRQERQKDQFWNGVQKRIDEDDYDTVEESRYWDNRTRTVYIHYVYKIKVKRVATAIPLTLAPSVTSTTATGLYLPWLAGIASIAYGISESAQGRNPVSINNGYMGSTNPGLYGGPVPNAWNIIYFKRISTNKAANEAAQGWGFKDAHELKKKHKASQGYDIYKDNKSGKGELRPFQKGSRKPTIPIVPKN